MDDFSGLKIVFLISGILAMEYGVLKKDSVTLSNSFMT